MVLGTGGSQPLGGGQQPGPTAVTPGDQRATLAGRSGVDRAGYGYAAGMTDIDENGLPAARLSEDDLLRELDSLHRTRHQTFLHGSTSALAAHTERTRELEDEYLRRHPERQIDPDRLRAGARARAGQPPTG